MHILITGNAGFIGFHLFKLLAEQGYDIYGIDSINSYYDVNLKKMRLNECGIYDMVYGKEIVSKRYPNCRFRQADLCDKAEMEDIFRHYRFDCIINLAAQAGVRYSLTHPETYVENNVVGFLNLLEFCRKHSCSKLIYASSSSVYGNSPDVPSRETQPVDHPVSLYAATKKSNELMAFTYSYLYGIQTIGLRFFTVYGPYGRPDMAPMLFAKAILHDTPIKIFNHGKLSRDFTYIDDITNGILKIVAHPGIVNTDTKEAPSVIYNIGCGTPVNLMDFICLLEKHLEKPAQKEYTDMQPGDVYQTWADTTKLKNDYRYSPCTPLETGIKQFTAWYKEYNRATKNQ